MRIRGPSRGELPVLQEVERAAGRCFHDIGMPGIAEDEPLPLGELARHQQAGMAWVAAEPTGEPVARREAAHGLNRWPRVCMYRATGW